MGLPESKAAVLALLGAMAGIEHAWDAPPINPAPADFPFIIAYPFEGELTPISEGLHRGLHTVVFELHQSRRVAPDSLVAVEVWPERILAVLTTETTLAPLNTMVRWPMNYKAGPLEYGKNVHYGVRFEITLKIH